MEGHEFDSRSSKSWNSVQSAAGFTFLDREVNQVTGLLFKLGEMPYQPALDLQVRVEEVLSPQVREMLQLRYDCADRPVAVIGAAPVPVTLRPLPENAWELTNPWETLTIKTEVEEFEGELLEKLAEMRGRAMAAFAPANRHSLN